VEASDLPGVGGPAMHTDLQWDGPTWGILATVGAGAQVLGGGKARQPLQVALFVLLVTPNGAFMTVF
jgi:hypothetical protein